jgi:hypothetical protein
VYVLDLYEQSNYSNGNTLSSRAILAAGLAIVPSTIQTAQANLCSADVEDVDDVNFKCKFYDEIEIDKID